MALGFIGSAKNMDTMRFSVVVMMAIATYLVVANAQLTALPDYSCSDSISKLSVPEQDPCANTSAYSELGSCANFMAGNATAPSANCCLSVQNVWSKFPGCFCKVTFFSKFPAPGPSLARARAPLCNITDDLCKICPHYMSAHHSENSSGGHSRINTASVVTVSVIVTLAVVGFVVLVYCCRKRAVAKKNQSQSKNYVPQFNNM